MKVIDNKVCVVDIKMPFWSMIKFMLKWAIASIPAVFILFVFGTAISVVVVELMK